jgi:hypothetical protein
MIFFRSTLAKDAIDLMSTIYKCNFDKGSMGYLSHVAQPAHQFLFKHNFRLWNICRFDKLFAITSLIIEICKQPKLSHFIWLLILLSS